MKSPMPGLLSDLIQRWHHRMSNQLGVASSVADAELCAGADHEKHPIPKKKRISYGCYDNLLGHINFMKNTFQANHLANQINTNSLPINLRK